jgi:ATP-dependent Lon protease
MPVSARKQLFDLSDEMATKVNIIFYTEAKDALLKSVAD